MEVISNIWRNSMHKYLLLEKFFINYFPVVSHGLLLLVFSFMCLFLRPLAIGTSFFFWSLRKKPTVTTLIFPGLREKELALCVGHWFDLLICDHMGMVQQVCLSNSSKILFRSKAYIFPSG